MTRKSGSGRVRCTSERDDRLIIMEVLRNRFLTTVEIAQRLWIARGINISERTVRRTMKERDLISRRLARGPELLRQHRVARLRFAREHANWTFDDWGKILFTDECRVGLRAPDWQERVYRRRGERFQPNTTRQTVSFHGGSIMVWGGISSEARTVLVVIEGRLTADRYVRETLQEHVLPYTGFIGEADFLLMHDNMRRHVAGVVNQYLNEVGIRNYCSPHAVLT